jgi:hypothetical protein
MDMPHLTPVEPDRPQAKRMMLAFVAIFIIAAFAFAIWINIPEWR